MSLSIKILSKDNLCQYSCYPKLYNISTFKCVINCCKWLEVAKLEYLGKDDIVSKWIKWQYVLSAKARSWSV